MGTQSLVKGKMTYAKAARAATNFIEKQLESYAPSVLQFAKQKNISGQWLQISGIFALVALGALGFLIFFGIFKLIQSRMNKGYTVFVPKE